MTSSSRTIRRFVAAVAVALSAVTASACSSGGIDAGAAAIVGDRRIPVSDVQTATAELNMLPGLQQQLPQRDVLGYLITEPFFLKAASAKGTGVSEDDAATFLRQSQWVNTRTGSTKPSASTLAFVRTFLARRSLLPQQDGSGPTVDEAIKTLQDVSAELKKTKISVNPRYGTIEKTFDPNGQGIFPITAASPDWLVKEQLPAATEQPAPPTEEPAPSPAAS